MLHLESSLQGKTIPSIYLTITGGGTGIISKLLENGGASSYFVGANVPYAQSQTENIFSAFIANPKEYPKVVSKESARVLAKYSEPKYLLNEYLAIGITASLMKAEGERAERTNEAYVCFNLSGKLYEYHWTFSKEDYFEDDDSLMGGHYCKTTRKCQEDQLVNLIYKTLVEILSE